MGSDDVVDVGCVEAEFFEIGEEVTLGWSVFVRAGTHAGVDEDVFALTVGASYQVSSPLCFPNSVWGEGVVAMRVPFCAGDVDEDIGGIAA